MNPWPFVGAAYGLVVIGTLTLTIASWRGMRRAETEAEREAIGPPR